MPTPWSWSSITQYTNKIEWTYVTELRGNLDSLVAVCQVNNSPEGSGNISYWTYCSPQMSDHNTEAG